MISLPLVPVIIMDPNPSQKCAHASPRAAHGSIRAAFSRRDYGWILRSPSPLTLALKRVPTSEKVILLPCWQR